MGAAREASHPQEAERRRDHRLPPLAGLRVVKPRVIICLGATAAQALLGAKFRVSVQRGSFVASPLAEYVTATVHPSSILRAPDDEARRTERARFIEDLTKIRKALGDLAG